MQRFHKLILVRQFYLDTEVVDCENEEREKVKMSLPREYRYLQRRDQ
jgi:hypothetical protein